MARVKPGAAALHDVPWDDAPVIAAYRDWLAARHPTRMDEIDRVLRAATAKGASPTAIAPSGRVDAGAHAACKAR
jgi:hypothetical protein